MLTRFALRGGAEWIVDLFSSRYGLGYRSVTVLG